MTKTMKLIGVKSVAVLSVLSLVTAFLVSGAVSSSAAHATSDQLTTFTIAAKGTFIATQRPDIQDVCQVASFEIAESQVTDGSGTLFVVDEGRTIPLGSLEDANATATTLDLGTALGPPLVLTGSNWAGYALTFTNPACEQTFSGLALKGAPGPGPGPNPGPTPDPSVVKPRTPQAVKVAGLPSAKSFKVSWKKPSTKGDRPVSGYRVQVNQAGKKALIINKKLGKKARSYKVSRLTLLKSVRSQTRGEVRGNLHFNVRVYALNGAGRSNAATSRILVRP